MQVDEDHVFFRAFGPGIDVILTTHQHMDGHLAGAHCTVNIEIAQPADNMKEIAVVHAVTPLSRLSGRIHSGFCTLTG